MEKDIQLFVPTFRVDECLAGIRECLEKGWTGLGFKTVAFEEAWKNYTGLPNAHFLNSATAGLHLATSILKAQHGWKDDDEVITTPLTFISTNHAILYAGLKPIFADIDNSLCLDPIDVMRKITPKTRAVMFVGMGGNTGRYNEIVDLCKERGLCLILDAAHMSGTRLKGKHVGHEADAVVFSYQAVKNLPTGDSGMICFKDVINDKKAREMSWLGINKDTYTRTLTGGTYKWEYGVEEVGWKYHGNSIMAAIALVQLKYLDDDNAHRQKLAAQYRELLSSSEKIRLVPIAEDCESSTHLFQTRVANRNELILKLNSHGVFPGVHYRDNTEYPMYAYARGSCQNAFMVSGELLSLPLHLRVTSNDVERIARLVLELTK